MATRFETNYRIKTGTNLGDPETWNQRLQDLDRRIGASEDQLSDVGAVADRIEATALQRLDNVITPLVIETTERVAQITNLFSAHSATENRITTGYQLFVIDAGERLTFAHEGYVGITPGNDYETGMLGKVESYDRVSGEIVITVEAAWGDGTYSDWTVSAAQPYGAHAGRTDNPHGVTAHQAGTYTATEIDQALAALKQQLIGANGSVDTKTLIGLLALINTNNTAQTQATATAIATATSNALALAIALG